MTMTTATEEWRPVPGYEERYEVSSLGRLRSLWCGTGQRARPLVLRPGDDGKGYMRTTLSDGAGKQRAWRVHQLVALAFLGPKPAGHEVRHLDGVRHHNTPDNLEYGTSAQNREDAVNHGTHNMARKTRCLRGHDFTEENTAMIKLRTGSMARRCRTCNREKMRAIRAARRKATVQA